MPKIATRNSFALLHDEDVDDDVDDATDCTTSAIACSVMDLETGKLLEHRHLRRDPKHKVVRDKSYANEIGRLCQGVGKHPTKPTTQRGAGTNTMRPIKFCDIPCDRV